MNERTSGNDSASSLDELAVFQAYIDLINSERETLWARHYALPLTNSLIVASLAISPNKWVALAMLGTGLPLEPSSHTSGMVLDAAALQSRRDICLILFRAPS